MGNVTDTMASPLKSFLRLSVALVVLAGLSVGPAMGQTFLDASLTGSGGDGSLANPYQSGQFQDALDDAASNDEAVVVLSGGSLNAPQGTSGYSVPLPLGASDDLQIKSEDAVTPAASRDLEIDLRVTIQSNNPGQEVQLLGVDLDFGGNALDFGSGDFQADIVVDSDAGGSASPGSVIFSGSGSEIQARNAAAGPEMTIDRLVVTSGTETTLQTPVQSTVTVTDELDIAGTLDLGSTNTLEIDAQAGSATDPTVNISGTVQNGTEVLLRAADDPDDDTFTVGGGGDLANVDFNVTAVADDNTDITLTGVGSYTVSASAPGDVIFSNLTEANNLTLTGSAPTETEALVQVNGDLTQNNASSSLTSQGDPLVVDGDANFQANNNAQFNGATTFEDSVVVAENGDATVSLQNITTFDDLLFSDAPGSGTATLELLAPGIEDFGALNDYDLNNVTGNDRGDASVVGGEFTAGGDGNIILNDGSGSNAGIHNLRFADDISVGSPSDLDVTTNGSSRVLFTGFSQEIGLDGDGTLSIGNVDILSNDEVNGEVEIQRDGNLNRTIDVSGRLRLLGGLFSTEGALDATDATLVRRIAEDAEGTISGGGASDFAYTAGGDVSNGGGGTDLPSQIIYMGGEEPDRTAADGSTGPELPDLGSANDDAQFVTTLVTRSPATITVDADNGRGSPAYEVGRIAARAGTFELATDVGVQNNGTVELLNGAIAEGSGSLNYPTINNVGSDGVNLLYSATPETPDAEFDSDGNPPEGSVFPYTNEPDTTGDEFPTESDAILDVTVQSVAASGPRDPGQARVSLADTDSAYRFNEDAQVQSGAALGFNGQTLTMNTVAGDENNLEVVNDGTVDSTGTDESLLRFAGDGLANAIGDVDGIGNSPKEFLFPPVEVNKPTGRVLFQMDNSATDEPDGFRFNGDFTIADAQNWDPSTLDGVEFESQNDIADVDVVEVLGNFTQNGGSVLAFDQHAGTEFTVDGDLTKNAAESSRFYAGGVDGSVSSFTVGGTLEQANGTFYAIVGTSFDVGGDVINNSPDKWPASQTGGFESEAFEVDGFPSAVATVGGSVTQEPTGTPVFDDPATAPVENEGIFLVEGFNGPDGEVSVGANFNQLQGTTEIPDATTASVTDTVSVEGGFFRANLGSDINGQPGQRFLTANLAVTDSLFEASTDSQVQNPVPQDTEPINPEPGLNDQIRVSSATDVQPGGRFALEGFELRQGGDLTLLGSGDAPEASVNDPQDAGLRGLVRLVNDGNTRQTVTTDESPSTYFHGLAVNASGDVELGSNVTLNRAAGGQGSVNDSVATGTVRPFGTLFLEDGDLYTTGDTLTVLEPEPTDGGDLIEAVSADERRAGNVAEASPVLGGSNATNVVGTMRRALSEQNADTGGQVSDGYIFPLGGTERPEYRALVLEQPTDEDEPEFFSVTSGEDPNEPLPEGDDVIKSDDAFNEGEEINLNVQSLPYFRVASNATPDFSSFNMRVISALKPGAVSEVRQLRLIQRNPGDWQEAGLYDDDAGSNIDDDAGQTGGPNADISGFRNVIHEGVNLDDGNIIAVASEQSINPLQEDGGVLLSGTVTYGGEGAGSVDVTATSGDTTATTTTSSDGTYSFAGLPAGSYDVTADPSGSPQGINATDALLAVQGFAGIEDLSDFQEEVADVNDSGSVNATDALLIAQLTAGNISEFDAGTFASTTASVDASTGAEGVEVQVAAYGDVNQSGSVGSSSSPNTLAVTTVDDDLGSTTAKTANLSGSQQEAINLPVSVDRTVELGAYSLSIDYPADKVSFEGVSSEDVLTRDANGTVHLAWFDRTGEQPMDLSSGDALATLQFTPAEDVESDATVEIGDIKGELAGADATPLSSVGLQVPEIGLGTPESFTFNGNYPNPVSGRTKIAFDLPNQANVSVEVYDMLGRNVMSIPKRSMSPGAERSISLNASDLSSGVYMYRLQVEMGDETIRKTGRMSIVK